MGIGFSKDIQTHVVAAHAEFLERVPGRHQHVARLVSQVGKPTRLLPMGIRYGVVAGNVVREAGIEGSHRSVLQM